MNEEETQTRETVPVLVVHYSTYNDNIQLAVTETFVMTDTTASGNVVDQFSGLDRDTAALVFTTRNGSKVAFEKHSIQRLVATTATVTPQEEINAPPE